MLALRLPSGLSCKTRRKGGGLAANKWGAGFKFVSREAVPCGAPVRNGGRFTEQIFEHAPECPVCRCEA